MRSPIDSLTFYYRQSFPLLHAGDCALLGVDRDLTIYTEEIYDEIGYMAQTAIRFSGDKLAVVDEGDDDSFVPLKVPESCTRSHSAWQTITLNFAGARHRGLREADRAADLVQPLTNPDKLVLAMHLGNGIQSPQILGIAESYVLAEARLASTLYFVCRRLRIAYALPQPAQDSEGLRYDYDTQSVYLAHGLDLHDQTETSLESLLTGLPEVKLFRPMDCILCRDHLFIADGGSAQTPDQAERLSHIHVWQIEGLPPSSHDESTWSQKLYD
jgi:hypothetical protein